MRILDFLSDLKKIASTCFQIYHKVVYSKFLVCVYTIFCLDQSGYIVSFGSNLAQLMEGYPIKGNNTNVSQQL